MKKQIIFIIISIIMFIISILLIEKMMNEIGGEGLGSFLILTLAIALYTIYAIYHLLTYKLLNQRNIFVILIIYWMTVSPFLTMWIWTL